MRKNNLRNKPFGSFEQLEARWPLAGNVTVAVDATGKLQITGDALGNGVTIQGLGNPGEFGIFGFDADGVATSINGTPNGAVFVSGVTSSLEVQLNDGPDTLLFWHFNHAGNLNFDTGAGEDSVYGGLENDPMFIVGNVTIGVGAGANTVFEQEINVVGTHEVHTRINGLYVDSYDWQGFTLINSTFADRVIYRTARQPGSYNISNMISSGTYGNGIPIGSLEIDANGWYRSPAGANADKYQQISINACYTNYIVINSNVMSDISISDFSAPLGLRIVSNSPYTTTALYNGYVGGYLCYFTNEYGYNYNRFDNKISNYVVGAVNYDPQPALIYNTLSLDNVYVTTTYQAELQAAEIDINNSILDKVDLQSDQLKLFNAVIERVSVAATNTNQPVTLEINNSIIGSFGLHSRGPTYTREIIGENRIKINNQVSQFIGYYYGITATSYYDMPVILTIDGSTLKQLSYNNDKVPGYSTWGSSDTIYVKNSTIDNIASIFGRNDNLMIVENSEIKAGTLYGNTGTDKLYNTNSTINATVKDFE